VKVTPLTEKFKVLVSVISGRMVQVRQRADDADPPRDSPLAAMEKKRKPTASVRAGTPLLTISFDAAPKLITLLARMGQSNRWEQAEVV
jgi:hypothetical protein